MFEEAYTEFHTIKCGIPQRAYMLADLAANQLTSIASFVDDVAVLPSNINSEKHRRFCRRF